MRASLTLTLLAAALTLAACGKPADQATVPAEPATAPAAPAPDAAAMAAAVAALPAPYNAADIENGKRKFALCASCHTLVEGAGNRTGPNLFGLFGRQAGTSPGFAYSDVVKNAGFAWEPTHLDTWLTNPKTMLPGTRMSFVGIRDAEDRRDLIAYLMVATKKP